MSGGALAAISALFWGVNGILIRKGVRDVDPLVATYVSLVPGALMLAAISPFYESWSFVTSPPWQALGAYAASGVVAFVLARSFHFISTRRIGASRSAVFQPARVLIAPLVGVLILGEAFTLRIAIGGSLLMFGFALVTSE